MAILTTNISNVSISVSGATTKTANISWTYPSLPEGAVIQSCVLSGNASSFTTGNKGATLTIGSTTVNSGSSFSINLGTTNTTSSITASFKGGHKQTNTSVTLSNLVYTVNYIDPSSLRTVTFVDWDGTVLKSQQVEVGTAATAPANPARNGYNFIGWDVDFSNITEDITVTAQYELIPVVLNDFPPFTDEGWYLDADCANTVLETYSYGFTTTVNTGWIGYYIPVPEDWYGKTVSISIESITENASLVI